MASRVPRDTSRHASSKRLAMSSGSSRAIFERPGYAERARPLLAPLAGREAHDSALDVIGGADWESLALLLQSYDLVERKTRNELNPASCLEFFPPLR